MQPFCKQSVQNSPLNRLLSGFQPAVEGNFAIP
jgi:hypothetical protein